MERGGPSYTVETLEALLRDGVAEPVVHPVGRGPAPAFPAWRRPDRILELCRLAVVPRGNHDPLDAAWVREHFPGREDRVTFLAGAPLAHLG